MTNEQLNGDGFGQGRGPEDVAAHGITPDDLEGGGAGGLDTDDVTPEDLTPADDDKPDRGANLGDLGDPGHMFDQTNGLVDGLEGNTDGSADDGATDAAGGDGGKVGDIDGSDDDLTPVVPPGR
jgi:hypothetical protein